MALGDRDDEGRSWVDPDLADGLDHPAAVSALRDAARRSGRRYELDRWFLNGRSGARVCTVHELGPSGDRRLILKMDRLGDDLVEHGEFARHVRALSDTEPTQFRGRLATLPTDPQSPPIEVGDGYWLAFQNVAGGNLDGMVVLTSLLAGVRGATLNPDLQVSPTPCDRGLFAELCATVIGDVLSLWAERPTRLAHHGTGRRAFNAAEFIQLFLGPRLDPGQPMRAQADHFGLGRTIELSGEPRPLVNPFALALDPTLAPEADLHILAGRAHGDLNPENILLRTDAVASANPEFFLVDLSRYSATAPLTRDPTNLLLTIVANTMGELPVAAREALLDVLVDPRSQQRAMLPVWLNILLAKATNRSLDWAQSHGYGDDWWLQSRLALVPCGLQIAARPWLSDDEREWFLRLAARAADAHLNVRAGPRRAPDSPSETLPGPNAGRTGRPGSSPASSSDTRLVGVSPAVMYVLEGHCGLVLSIAYSWDGTHLATASTDRKVRIWNAATGALVRTLTGHAGLVMAMAYSPDGVHLATVSDDSTLRIWDTRTNVRRHTGHRHAVHSVTYSPDGRLIATASADNTVRVSDAGSGELVYSLVGHVGPVMSVAYSPDAAHLASASSDSTARIWRAADGRWERTLSGHSGPVNAAVYSPSGRHLATASVDWTIQTWHTAAGRRVRRFTGHTGTVFALAYSPDGTHIASGADDSTVRIWRASTGRILHTLTSHSGTVFAVAYSPDGTQLATGSGDETVRIWRVAERRTRATGRVGSAVAASGRRR